MKRAILGILAVIFGLALCASTASAYPVSVGEKIEITASGSSTAYGGGGEFNVVNQAGTVTFKSFCLELNETIQLNTFYTISGIATAAVRGGIGGGHPDPLDPKTAYLYYNFSQGTLSGYSGSSADQALLQYAIWMLEDEIESGQAGYSESNKFWLAANASGWTDIGSVRVLNLIDGNCDPRQSILVTTPEPMTLLLLGIGFVGLAGLRRKNS